MKKIIVATDFSESATNAVIYAADMAGKLDAGIVLLHTYQPYTSASEIPLLIDTEKEMAKAANGLRDLRTLLQQRIGSATDIQTRLIQNSFYQGLSTLCEEINPCLVVMGSQGTSAVERLMAGSQIVHTIQQLPWPLVTVPPDAIYKDISRIGLACDLHDVLKIVPAEQLKELVQLFKAELHVLNNGPAHCYDPEVVVGSETLRLILAPCRPQFHFLASEDTEPEIMEFINSNNIDLLVVMPRHHGLLYKLTHHSSSKYFVLHASVPVLLLHKK